ncbi:MAG: serine hydrolase domain-containing protein [Pseudomonadota bacterium]
MIGPAEPADPWARVAQRLDTHHVDDLVLIVGTAEDEVFRYEKGSFGATDIHRVASASKWLTSATILTLVEQGLLDLADRPQDYLAFWTDDPEDARSAVTLAQLLSFTSGFHIGPREPGCIGGRALSLQECVRQFYEAGLHATPGATYFYGPAHMQVASAMAEVATGQPWSEIFELTVSQPLSMSGSSFPAVHPRASGSARSTAADYAAFLQAHLTGWLSDSALAALARPRLEDVDIVSRPAAVEASGADWSYGLGVWRECAASVWDDVCASRSLISSPGAFGWYPWLDLDTGYFAVLAVDEWPTAWVNPAADSVVLGHELQTLIEQALAP